MLYYFSVLLIPFVKLFISYRTLKGLEDKIRIKEREGFSLIKRPNGILIWFHTASVGETVSIIPLIKLYKTIYPTHTFLLTTITLTSAQIWEKNLKDYCIHQYAPFDIGIWVERFLNHWQPQLYIGVESELWPNRLYITHKKNIPLILLNARISEKSYNRWLKIKFFIRSILKCFEIILAPSANTAKRLENLGGKNIKLMTHLKFSANPLPTNHSELDILKNKFKNRVIWVAASTHTGEEEIVLNAHNNLKLLIPNILTVIIPRHPSRAEEVEKLCSSYDCTVEKRTSNLDLNDTITDIYIVDTIGELGLFYTLSSVVCIGGSFIPHGGHNPIEPALFECNIIWGPYMTNFQDICAVLAEACFPIQNKDDLINTVKNTLLNPKDYEESSRKVKQIVKEQSKELPQIINILQSTIAR